MSLPLSARSLADTEYFKQLYRLSDEIIQLLLRDFGLKTLNSDLNVFVHRAKMLPEDKDLFFRICEKYHLNVETTYPLWIIDYFRTHIMQVLQDMLNNVTTAYTIYPTSEKEYYDRKHYFWLAISNCYQLKQVMQLAIRNLPVDSEKYMRYIDMIELEIKRLRERKKADNKILKAIKKKQILYGS